jgi:hypothetical protein
MFCPSGGGFLGSDAGTGALGQNPGFLNASGGYSKDVFGRIVTETPTTLFTSHTAFTPQYEWLDYASTGTGSVFVDLSNTLVRLSASGSGGRAIRQSHEYQLYQPAKSHVSYMTCIPQYQGTFDNSVAIRFGIYDDYRDKNTPAGLPITPSTGVAFVSSIYGGTGQETSQPSMGHYFELSGNQWFVVERANSPNNIINVNRVPQSQWNIDTCGLNPSVSPSGFRLETNQSQSLIALVERQWLGVGSVRMGFFTYGRPIFVHSFQLRGLNRAYTHLPKLPIRFEIEKVAGGSDLSANFASICMSSHVMGDYTPFGSIFSLPAELTNTVATVDTALRPILAIRLQQQYCRATFKLKDIEIFASADANYALFKNPVISNSISWIKNPDTRSMIEYAWFSGSVNRTISGGLCTRSGYVDKTTSLQDSLAVTELATAPPYCSDIAGNPDILVLAVQGHSGNTNFRATFRWLELV